MPERGSESGAAQAPISASRPSTGPWIEKRRDAATPLSGASSFARRKGGREVQRLADCPSGLRRRQTDW